MTRTNHTNTDLPIIITAGPTVTSSHRQERGRRKNQEETRIPKNTCTELANVFFELPTQHAVLELSALDQCLIVTVHSDNIVVVVVVVVVAVTQQPNNQDLQHVFSTAIHNKLADNIEKPGQTARVLIPPLGSSQTQGPAFIRYPFVSQQLEFPKPLHLPRKRGPTLILAQSGSRWGFPPHQPQPVSLVPTVSFARADSSNS